MTHVSYGQPLKNSEIGYVFVAGNLRLYELLDFLIHLAV